MKEIFMILRLHLDVQGECPYCGSNTICIDRQWRHPRYYDLYVCESCGFTDELPVYRGKGITRAEQRVLLELLVRCPHLKTGDQIDIFDLFPDANRHANARRQAIQRLAAKQIFTCKSKTTFVVPIATLKAIEWCVEQKGRLDSFEWWKYTGDLPF